jgi:tetratricopeptide (TPR) repeat protein
MSGRGINPLIAVQGIIGRKEAVMEKSNHFGHDYAFRVLPYTIRVSRDYYVRGTENFNIAKRRAQTGDWDGAAKLWEKEVAHPKPKIAGRATYNMAIINEINGDLDKAVEWASRSYTDYENKLALNYLRILKNRMAKNEQLLQESQE